MTNMHSKNTKNICISWMYIMNVDVVVGGTALKIRLTDLAHGSDSRISLTGLIHGSDSRILLTDLTDGFHSRVLIVHFCSRNKILHCFMFVSLKDGRSRFVGNDSALLHGRTVGGNSMSSLISNDSALLQGRTVQAKDRSRFVCNDSALHHGRVIEGFVLCEISLAVSLISLAMHCTLHTALRTALHTALHWNGQMWYNTHSTAQLLFHTIPRLMKVLTSCGLAGGQRTTLNVWRDVLMTSGDLWFIEADGQCDFISCKRPQYIIYHMSYIIHHILSCELSLLCGRIEKGNRPGLLYVCV